MYGRCPGPTRNKQILRSDYLSPKRVLLAYHFFHPDDVVSARLFTDLALGLHAEGWDVTALTSDRAWATPASRYPATERFGGIAIERAHRPAWGQSRPTERLANSGWMLGAWLAHAAAMAPFDAVVVGSDPSFAPLVLVPLRRLWPAAAMAHWCFDLYPEVIAAEGSGAAVRALYPVAKRLMASAYRRCDAIVDLGPRMRERLEEYESPAVRATVVPWALVEPAHAPRPADPRVREELFGDARLGLLYSGSLGRAHDFRTLLALARACRARSGDDIVFCFSCRGHRLDELKAALRPSDSNVRIAPFCAEGELALQLEAADVHLMSLQSAWSGLVVPSKFFGSLAVGRPVVYAGPPDSDVARWIAELNLGYIVASERGESRLVDALHRLARSPEELLALQQRSRQQYDVHFRKELGISAKWHSLLSGLVQGRAQTVSGDRAVLHCSATCGAGTTVCGIFGYVLRRDRPSDWPSLEGAIRDLKHRGPDGDGTFRDEAADPVCGFAHTRLAIIDLSAGGRQPMTTLDGRYTIAFNGEVYNYRDIRRELEAAGYRMRSGSDTEVILQAYDRWGPAAVERLRGMFAFAIWDARERRLFLARDRLGVKPLYYAQTSGGIVFASEVRALLATGLVDRALDARAVDEYLAFGSLREPRTIVRGVAMLPAGSTADLHEGELRVRSYWAPPLRIDREVSRPRAVEECRELLAEAVRLRLVSDVPVGVFLSGGMDSSAIVALAARSSEARVHSFTVTFDEAAYDESGFATDIAKRFGVDHQAVHVSSDHALEHIDDALAALDQPSADGTNTYFVAKAAREAGLTVALSGIGGDEIFAGYPAFRRFARLTEYGRWLRGLARFSGVASSVAFPSAIRKGLALWRSAGDPFATYAAMRAMFLTEERSRVAWQPRALADVDATGVRPRRWGHGCARAKEMRLKRTAFSTLPTTCETRYCEMSTLWAWRMRLRFVSRFSTTG